MANQKPFDEVRIGTAKATNWQKEVADKTPQNVTFSRIYRDADRHWKTTLSFGRKDLLVLVNVTYRAHSRTFELQQTEEVSEQAA